MNEKDENFFHIFFNGGEKEIKRNCIKPNEKVSKIKILIDKEIKSYINGRNLIQTCMIRYYLKVELVKSYHKGWTSYEISMFILTLIQLIIVLVF